MKKYILIDTFNGSGYSESNAQVIETDLEPHLFLSQYFVKNAYTMTLESIKRMSEGVVRLSYSNADDEEDEDEDHGAYVLVPDDEEILAVLIKPNVNDYELIRSNKHLDNVTRVIKALSDDIGPDGNIFNACHHNISDGEDWILQMIHEKPYKVIICPSSETEEEFCEADSYNEALKLVGELDSAQEFKFDTLEEMNAFTKGYMSAIGWTGEGCYITNIH